MAYLPFWRMYLFMWVMVHGAVMVNTTLIWTASRAYNQNIFDFWNAWAILFPMTLLGAYFMTRWVRGLVREAEQGR
ncbi:MAG: hypothetical protein P8Q92_01840 [Pseudoprimorskyibacter sp.]|nr:hypothetical protein [Pseudoprimorskyibacter sp.]